MSDASHSATCPVCNSDRPAIDLGLRREVLTDGTWHPHAIHFRTSLCRDCGGWFGELLSAAALGRGDPAGRLGVPIAGPDGAGAGHVCDFCRSALGGGALVLEMAPESSRDRGGRLTRHQRLCPLCGAWVRSVLENPSAMRGTSRRAIEGPSGGWRSFTAGRAAHLGLERPDAAVIGTTTGAPSREIGDARSLQAALAQGFIAFVGASRENTEAIQRLDPPLRPRVTVIARFDGAGNALAAMRAGAMEFLSSPLTPQQVAATIDRVSSAAYPAERGALGLPLYREPFADGYGHPQVITIEPSRPELAANAALMLRRFIRGYDRVGEDAAGKLVAHVYCPPEHATAVRDRLRVLLADTARVPA